MKSKRLIFWVVGILVVFSLNSWAENKKIMEMGHYPFTLIRGNGATEAGIKKMLVKRYAKDLKTGFTLAGNPELYTPFMEQLKTVPFVEKSIPVGTVFPWMLFRSNGKVKVSKDLEWAGKASLDVFSFTVTNEDKKYEFIIPRKCGNVTLLSAPPAILPVVCDLKVAPAKANVNDPIEVDMSGSQNATSMEVSVYDAAGALIATQALSPSSAKWQIKLDKPGEFVFKAKASNPGGEASGPGCEVKVKINYPPTCKLAVTCTECKNFVGKPIVFDASDSSDEDGNIVKAKFDVLDATGALIESYTASEKPFAWKKVFTKAGAYTMVATVFDDMGAASSAEPCRIPFRVTAKKLFGLVEGGPGILRGTYTGTLWARGGLLFQLVPDTLDFILSLGGGIPIKGDPWKSYLMGNALLSAHTGNVYWAGGLGFSTKEQTTRKGGIDLVGQVGVDLFKVKSSVGSILGELRAPVITSDRSFDEHHKILLGFRYIF